MVVSNDVLDGLKAIGLNLYERKIYVALLAKGIATAGEVSSIAKVPRSRSYDILESLSEKGFVILQPSKPIRYVALEPADALERVQQNLELKHNEMQERVEKLKGSQIVTEMNSLYKKGFSLVQPFEMTGTIKGRNAINQQLRSVLKKAKSNVTVVTTKNGANDLHATHFNTLKKLSKRGVKIRIFAHGKDTPKRLSEVADVRNIDSALGRICTVDNEHVIMSLTDDEKTHQSQDVAFWANSPHLVRDVMQPIFARMGAKK